MSRHLSGQILARRFSLVMSILKKFFSKTPEVVEAQPRAGARRAPRFRAEVLKELSFSREGSGEILKIHNLSSSGVAFENSPGSLWPEKSQFFYALLTLGDEVFRMQMQTVHVTTQTVGFRFINPAPELNQRLREKFKLEFLATELVRIDSKHLKSDEPGMETQWFRGAGSSELFLRLKDGSLHSFSLVFGIHRIEGTPNRIRYLKIDPKYAKRAYDETLYQETPVDEATRNQVMRFILSIEALSEELRQVLLSLFGRA